MCSLWLKSFYCTENPNKTKVNVDTPKSNFLDVPKRFSTENPENKQIYQASISTSTESFSGERIIVFPLLEEKGMTS